MAIKEYELKHFIRLMNDPEKGDVVNQTNEMALYSAIGNDLAKLKGILISFIRDARNVFPETKELYCWVLSEIGEIDDLDGDILDEIKSIYEKHTDISVKAYAIKALAKIAIKRTHFSEIAKLKICEILVEGSNNKEFIESILINDSSLMSLKAHLEKVTTEVAKT